ncbi:n-alpha-acetyltransferase catalytic subunit [Blastocystis sp. subtype 4]|uniref:n-alpha-acetyltransferase catalytic subunit n=1 Tax=Blastocystis sp. subtype 4 TaxID=944170 RepID=UPI0007118138|nr:n-alpha-acetyltransferase catalytic subunit [Blastocystis sp. subtype 4]KNB43134.1 n-alpha-acetyltransferase catalytic subunit [Blastocystis sp. subtype 4]|eukprot:XP_014526577.1 n-alpha-acetyltransferase catalytic subunit [Blastocystis sp. subtype 4]
MASIRQFTTEDLILIQTQNLLSLPENYTMKYYYFHILSSPELSFVAVNDRGEIVGYVLGKVDEDIPKVGNITSVAVSRSYRRMGIAQKLMRQVQRKMIEVYHLERCTLNVRETNYAAYHLYHDVLGFKRLDVDVKYYADGENGIKMEQDLIVLAKEWGLNVYIDSQSDKKVEKGSKKRSNA